MRLVSLCALSPQLPISATSPVPLSLSITPRPAIAPAPPTIAWLVSAGHHLPLPEPEKWPAHPLTVSVATPIASVAARPPPAAGPPPLVAFGLLEGPQVTTTSITS